MKALRNLCLTVLAGAFLAIPAICKAAAPVYEVDGPFLQNSEDWEVIMKVNLWYNEESRKALDKILAKKRGMRETALAMAQKLSLDGHQSLLRNPQGSSMDFRNQGDLSMLQPVLEEISLSSYVNMTRQVKVVTFEPPKWMPSAGGGGSMASLRTGRANPKILKVAGRLKSAIERSKSLRRLEGVVQEMAEDLFPKELLKNFDVGRVAEYLLAKSGVVEIAEGVKVRPSVPQDKAYMAFANLGCDKTDEALFWSDPMVVNGYDPVWGMALNRTALTGHKTVDMDNVVSRGRSQAIDKWNLLQPSDRRIENPFRGYAAKVVPGLITMGEQGRLSPGEDPTKEQLEEAIKLTKAIKMLPSDFMNQAKPQMAAARGDRVISNDSFKFVYPKLQTIRVAGGGTRIVELAKLDLRVYKNIMDMDKDRLKDIAKLKNENLRSRRYVKELLGSYKHILNSLEGISKGMDLIKSIPQVTQLRKDLFSSIEECRYTLSILHFYYDDLKHKEWEVLNHVLETEQKYILKQMDNAAIRDGAALHALEAGS